MIKQRSLDVELNTPELVITFNNEQSHFCVSCKEPFTVKHFLITCIEFHPNGTKYFNAKSVYRSFLMFHLLIKNYQFS